MPHLPGMRCLGLFWHFGQLISCVFINVQALHQPGYRWPVSLSWGYHGGYHGISHILICDIYIYIFCIGWRCFWWKMMINRDTGVGFSSLRQSQIDNGEWYRSQYRKILQECTRRSMDHVHSMDHLAHHDVFSCNSFGAAREDSCPFWDSWDTLSAVVFHVSLRCSS